MKRLYWPTLIALLVAAALIYISARRIWWSAEVLNENAPMVTITGLQINPMLIAHMALLVISAAGFFLFGRAIRVVMGSLLVLSGIVQTVVLLLIEPIDYIERAQQRNVAHGESYIEMTASVSGFATLTVVTVAISALLGLTMILGANHWPQRSFRRYDRHLAATDPWKSLDEGRDPTLD